MATANTFKKLGLAFAAVAAVGAGAALQSGDANGQTNPLNPNRSDRLTAAEEDLAARIVDLSYLKVSKRLPDGTPVSTDLKETSAGASLVRETIRQYFNFTRLFDARVTEYRARMGENFYNCYTRNGINTAAGAVAAIQADNKWLRIWGGLSAGRSLADTLGCDGSLNTNAAVANRELTEWAISESNRMHQSFVSGVYPVADKWFNEELVKGGFNARGGGARIRGGGVADGTRRGDDIGARACVEREAKELRTGQPMTKREREICAKYTTTPQTPYGKR